MILSEVSDKILVLPSASIELHIHGSWRDIDATTGKETGAGRTILNPTSAAAAVAVPANTGKANYRRVEHLTVKTEDSAGTVTIQFSDGTTTVNVFSADLEPGDQICFDEGRGFYTMLASGIPALESNFVDADTPVT